MRFYIFLLLACLILFVVVEAKSSNSTHSKTGKVSKIRTKPIRKHSSVSSSSSEERWERHKKSKKPLSHQLEEFKSKERNKDFSHSEVSSFPHKKLHSRHNTTRHFEGSSKNNSYEKNIPLLTKNVTSNQLSNKNHTQSGYGFKNNTTVPSLEIGWKNFTNHNSSINKSNYLNNNDGQNLQLGKDSDHNSKKNITTPIPFGWNSGTPPYGWKNGSVNPPLYGWSNNSLIKAPPPGSSNNSPPVGTDFRQFFAVPDRTANQPYYFTNPNLAVPYPSNPNLIADSKQPSQYPTEPHFNNRKAISNISPEYGWNIHNPASFSETDHNKAYVSPSGNFDPIYNNNGAYDKSSSKPFKGAKKVLKKFFKSVGKGVSDDSVKDKIKEAASFYFSNPPPVGWVYNPPYQNSKLMNYGKYDYYRSLLQPDTSGRLSVDDWRSIIFGKGPVTVGTRQLYSTAFPETLQNFNLNPFSEKGNLPNFDQKSYKTFFPPPYYPKLFAGLQNDAVNDNFREKRELTNKTKTLIAATNKFLHSERDCDDTELNARRKRQLMTRTEGGKGEGETRISNFPFSWVRAIVQSDQDISVFGGVPEEELSYDSSSIEAERLVKNRILESGGDEEANKTAKEKTKALEHFTSYNTNVINNIFPEEPPDTDIRNRTKLYPVYETIEQLLAKKPVTRLSILTELLEKWKAGGTSFTDSSSSAQRLELIDPTHEREVNSKSWKRPARSEEDQKGAAFTLLPQKLSNDGDLKRKDEIGSSWLSTSRSVAADINIGSYYSFSPDDISDKTKNSFSSGKYISNSNIDREDEVSVQPATTALPTTSSATKSAYLPDDIKPYTYEVKSLGSSIPGISSVSPKKKGMYFFGVYVSDYKTNDWKYSGTTESAGVNAATSLLDTQNYSLERSNQRSPEDSVYSSAIYAKSSEANNGYSSKNSAPATIVGSSAEGTFIENLINAAASENTAYSWQTTSDYTSPNPPTEVKSDYFSLITPAVDSSDSWKSRNILTTSRPFKINKIASYSSSFHQNRTRNHQDKDKSVSSDTVLIYAPLRKIVCGPHQRPLNGVCRRVW